MGKYPESIEKLLNGEKSDEIILCQDNDFIVLKDIKWKDCNIHNLHYTAWTKKNINSLLELNKQDIRSLKLIKQQVLEKIILKEDELNIYMHFPPNFWKLHIHYVSKKVKIKASSKIVHYLDDVINNLENNNYYREKVIIESRI